MSSNSRVTHSKGPAEDVSLPLPTRIKKDVNTEVGGEESIEVQDQANHMESQLNTADNPSPFARPGSRAGTSIAPADAEGMCPASTNPFTQLDRHTGFAPPDTTSPKVTTRFPNVPSSPISPTSSPLFQEDVNTSSSWDSVDPWKVPKMLKCNVCNVK